ncbi:MAG: hypothetical protein KBB83_04155 [Alphaproteobacteria bacterium]|nr:hypothetical protein [Alphaproteobacteria bacterium]
MKHYIRLSFIIILIIFSQNVFASGIPDPEQESPPKNIVTQEPMAPNGDYVVIQMNNLPPELPGQVREQDLPQQSTETASENRAEWLVIPAVGCITLFCGLVIWGAVEETYANAASNHTFHCWGTYFITMCR